MINDHEKIDYLYKSKFNRAVTSPNKYLCNESNIQNHQYNLIDYDKVPNIAPTLNNLEVSGSIQYYDKCIFEESFNDKTFYLSKFVNAIPFNYGFGYNYKLYDNLDNIINLNRWFIDHESGILIFYGDAPLNIPLKISFYRYIGRTESIQHEIYVNIINGFNIGDLVYQDGVNWLLVTNNNSDIVQGIVSRIIINNKVFCVTFNGIVKLINHSIGFDGAKLYINNDGYITIIRPNININQIGNIIDPNYIYFNPQWKPQELEITSSVQFGDIKLKNNDNWTQLKSNALSNYSLTYPPNIGLNNQSLFINDVVDQYQWKYSQIIHFTDVINESIYNVNVDDYIINVRQTLIGPCLIVLPESFYVGKIIIIKDSGGNSNIYNITVNSTTLIDGSNNIIIDINYSSITMYFDGMNWNTIF